MPLVYFLGQTIPITMNLFPKEHLAGKTGGHVLAISTTGSFLGAILTSTLIMNYFGVAANNWFNCIILSILIVLLIRSKETALKMMLFAACMLAVTYIITIHEERKLYIKNNSYASYQIFPDSKIAGKKILSVNLTYSSALNKNLKGFRYIEIIKRILFDDLRLRGKDILVLGAGGFTLSAEKTQGNHFDYVDIDKQIKAVVVPAFIPNVNGTFIGADARSYLLQTDKKYSAIVTDVYSNFWQMPPYLLTREFFTQIKTHLTKHGIAIFNMIAKPTLSDPFSKRVDNTIRSVFSNCMAEPTRYADKLANIIYICNNNAQSTDQYVYSDNLNPSSTDNFSQNSKTF